VKGWQRFLPYVFLAKAGSNGEFDSWLNHVRNELDVDLDGAVTVLSGRGIAGLLLANYFLPT
jgi:hypothetical protein